MPPSNEQRRDQILHEIRQIQRLRRGTLSEQYFERRLAAGGTRRQGPYYVLQRQQEGRKISQRIQADQADQVREDIEGYEQFVRLSTEWVELTEHMTCAADVTESKKKPSGFKRSVSGRPRASSP